MIDRVFIQHQKMKRVDWSCVTDDGQTAGLSISAINRHLNRLELPYSAKLQFHVFAWRMSESAVYGWLYLIAGGQLWTVERLGPFNPTNKGWENLLDLGDFLGEKLPGLALSWKAYNESKLWC